MSIQYTNRKGDVYYLHVGKTKKGNPTYHFSKKKDGPLAESIPEGFEIYENPDAQVFLRRIRPKIVTDEEIEIVRNGVRDLAGLEHFIIDVKKDAIVVYTANNSDAFFLDGLADKFGAFYAPKVQEALIRNAHYTAMMQFILTDVKTRRFTAQRWCFRGRIDDWIDLAWCEDLSTLVRKFCPHLGKESFYELPYLM